MTATDQFLLALKAYQEIQSELHSQELSHPLIPGPDPLGSDRVSAAGLPGGSLVLGMAEDGLPVMLDLYDSRPGPLLVAGDGGSGKTALLQSLAYSSNLQDPGDISFGVLTPFPEEWSMLETLPHCLGIWPAYHPSASEFISQLVAWSEDLPETRQAVLLLFDGFDLMTGTDLQYQHDLRWLLMYGPERQVWPVISVNPARLTRLQAWLEYFHTRILGKVKHAHNARSLVNDSRVALEELIPGKEFGLFQSERWLKFWLPPLI
jgi:hypothetical protein